MKRVALLAASLWAPAECHLGRLRADAAQPAADSAQREAVARLEAIEDEHTSKVLCRLKGEDGQGSATVRLQAATNERSLVFNDDVNGVETRVKCRGAVAAGCLNAPAEANHATSIDSCAKCPCEGSSGQLFGQYGLKVSDEVERRCQGKQSEGATRVLLLGLGGGELATHLAQKCDGSVDMEAVELDGRLPQLAQQYFGLPTSVKVTVSDAGSVVAALDKSVTDSPLQADQKRYDVIFVDCFTHGGVTPESCRSPDFVHSLQKLVRAGGVVQHHLWHVDPRHAEVAGEFAATVALYKQVFQCDGCSVSVQDIQGGPDSVLFARVPAGEAEDA